MFNFLIEFLSGLIWSVLNIFCDHFTYKTIQPTPKQKGEEKKRGERKKYQVAGRPVWVIVLRLGRIEIKKPHYE